ncbi:MAG: hypothetical protein GF384_02470 [Elusimicrobia bacterium]|nr:hypothetical protein [Elusimicrobiota bacterium]MBD3411832.1 hypothetical protein [Elusimicrobiota bacterium]
MKQLQQSLFILLISACIIMAVDNHYGHKQYTEASQEDLVVAGHYPDGRKIYLSHPAADAYANMNNAAQKDGIAFILISGFRTIQYQKRLFNRAVKKYGSEEEAARHVAPPGCSEHHTGRAVDIGDKKYPKSALEVSFEKTPAFKWLQNNAERFGFVMSFPDTKNSPVSYEPWHWCYHDK